MAEASMTSAVALPDSDRDIPRPDSSLKRRQSIRENRDSDSKRRRLSVEDKNHPAPSPAATATHTTSKNTETETDGSRRKPGPDEERKRGKRLFGSLLGTLSQTSTSAAQQRRADIEKKQQDKLKSQDTEYHEEKRKKHDELIEARRKEQKVYNRQTMDLRHSSMLSMAHFLKTKAEPVLYYKPWQLRSEEESKIEKQIEEAKSVISRDVEEFDQRNPPTLPANPDEEAPGPSDEAPADGTQPSTATEEVSKDTATNSVAETGTVGAENNSSDQQEQLPHSHPDSTDTGANNDNSPGHIPPDDDNEEVMLEDNEDTVIY